MRSLLVSVGVVLVSHSTCLAADPQPVQTRDTTITIPTYPLGPADKNPIFYHGRKYQGAQGPVYPYAMLDKLGNRPEDRKYRAVYLENQHVQFIVLPELGGRIFAGLDKSNNYDFFYRQHVIKPALVGMAGAWISGGVEWNIPHHHRATTFMPVDCRVVDNDNGSKTVWVGEIERRHRMKWLVGLTLYPDRSYLEVTTKLINRTAVANSMLCFANAAVHANRDYQVLFPPNTQFGTQHAKREFVHWPIGGEVYHKLDRTGVDLSWWRNQPSPVSIFAWNYEDDFVGGYDHGKQAGVVHVADHHVAPGKKFFTWGCGEEGQMWDRALTENDGPYIELMAGAYSDNQPDYSWIQPYETRTVTEYWYPLRVLGGLSNANRDAAIYLDTTRAGKIRVAVNATTSFAQAEIVLRSGDNTIWRQTTALSPGQPFQAETALPSGIGADELMLSVSSEGRQLIAYHPKKREAQPTPESVTPPLPPAQVKTVDELCLIGLRLEQFHNPALDPDLYYNEALRRDPGDVRANTASGIRLCRRGDYRAAEGRLRTALARAMRHYTIPKDTEALYYLGVALDRQYQYKEAEKWLHRATWGQAWVAASNYALAESTARRGELAAASEFLERSLENNSLNSKALLLRAMIERKQNRPAAAQKTLARLLALDPLDLSAGHEQILLARGDQAQHDKLARQWHGLMRGEAESYLEVAADYAACGDWREARAVVEQYLVGVTDRSKVNPMVFYDLAYFCYRAHDEDACRDYSALARRASPDYCFPFRLESGESLACAAAASMDDAQAFYYMGNLLYDRQPKQAIWAWERARRFDLPLATVHRNLGWAYAFVQNDYPKALASFSEALRRDPNDPRLLAEIDPIAEWAREPAAARLARFEQHADVAKQRDDSLLRYVGVCLLDGKPDKGLDLLANHHFRRWEGENGPHEYFVEAHLLRAQAFLKKQQPAEAERELTAALEYPENFEIGRPLRGGPDDAQVYYLLGQALEAQGKADQAKARFRQAAAASGEVTSARYYQALALRKLGDKPAAEKLLAALVEAGQQVLDNGPKIDYFGIFGTPLPKALHLAQAHYLIALGKLGQGQTADGQRHLTEALTQNPSHLGAQTMRASLQP